MLALLKHLDREKLCPRTYVIASTDSMGAQKAHAAEKSFSASKVLSLEHSARQPYHILVVMQHRYSLLLAYLCKA